MLSPSALRPVGVGEYKIEVRSQEVDLHQKSNADHLPARKITVVVNGGKSLVRGAFEVNGKSDHLVVAVKMTPYHQSLLFIAYKCVGDQWQQQERVILDPEGNLDEEVGSGAYIVANLHRYHVRF